MRVLLTVATLWTLGLLAACLVPGERIPEVDIDSFDKLVHVGLFAGFGFLWLRVAPGRRVTVALYGLALAILIELLQHGLPIHRSGDALDVVADAVGLALALAADAAWRRWRPATRPPGRPATVPRARP